MPPAAPTVRRMGRYALYEKIASGGMATLYFGRLLGPSGFARTVAVKCLHPQLSQDPDFSAMFLDEARLASRIRSPYVVPTLDVVNSDGELAIVMEYVHGESLGVLIGSRAEAADRAGPSSSHVPVAVAVSVLGEVLEGLHAAHEARSESGAPLGMVHRDVSPQNVLVGTDGLAHLIDFGVAKAQGRLQTTREGQLKGKLPYMAPEQLRGEPVTRRSDVYAASVMLWELLVGERLFRAGDEGAIVTRVLLGEVPPPSKALRGDRDPADARAIERLDAVVMRGLDREPARRFETAHEMALALEQCVAPASAAEVTAWLEQAAGPVLARRAAAIAAFEAQVADASISLPGRERDVDPAAAPTREDASSPSVVPGITTGTTSSRRRRASLLVLAGLLLSATLAAARMSWRASADARPSAAPAPPSAIASSEPAPADSAPPAASLDPAAADAPAAVALPRTSVATPPPKRGPSAPHPSDCNPPFTWDDQGKKHYKRQCL